MMETVMAVFSEWDKTGRNMTALLYSSFAALSAFFMIVPGLVIDFWLKLLILFMIYFCINFIFFLRLLIHFLLYFIFI